MSKNREEELKELEDLERRFIEAAKKYKSSEQSLKLAEVVVRGIREGVLAEQRKDKERKEYKDNIRKKIKERETNK